MFIACLSCIFVILLNKFISYHIISQQRKRHLASINVRYTSHSPITVADQNWRKRGSPRNTDALIIVTMRGFSFRCVRYACMLCTLCVCIAHIAGKAPLFCTHVICALIDYMCGIVANGI